MLCLNFHCLKMFHLSNNEIFVLLISTIFGLILYKLKRKYSHWKNLNIPHIGFPQDLLLVRNQNRSYVIKNFYEKLAPHPVGGIYVATDPVLLIRDPEIARLILIKDFSSFVNRSFNFDEKLDPLRAHILNLRDQRWKNIRSKLTPTFSSGKIKSMFVLLDECTKVLHEHLDETLQDSPEIDVRSLMTKFAADVIGTCAFGLDCNVIKDENSEFRRIISMLTPRPYRIFLRTLLNSIHPKLMSWLGWKFVNPELEIFFTSVTEDAIKNRAENELKRNDFLQLLINVQHEEQKMLQSQNDKSEPLFKDNVLAAHVLIFFVAGFDTTATTLSYCLYELALHPEIMDRVYKEIKQVETAHGGKLDYDSFKEMHYMECVISETLRKHPAAGLLDRVCNKTYQIPNSSVVVKKDTRVIISVYALHRDPKYFPDPEKFDPERFNEENKSKIVPGSYLPFGDGPRICIAMRFALVEIKAALTKIIGNYTIHPTEKTEIPITLNPNSILNTPKTIYLRFQKRVQ